MNGIGGVLNQPGNSGNGGGAGGGSASDSEAKAFSAAVAPGLTVGGNSIDTGRYVVTGSNQHVRPNDGITAGDGMVSIMDKATNSFVDVFGDPHVYASGGDRAEFQKDSLWINLGDGTLIGLLQPMLAAEPAPAGQTTPATAPATAPAAAPATAPSGSQGALMQQLATLLSEPMSLLRAGRPDLRAEGGRLQKHHRGRERAAEMSGGRRRAAACRRSRPTRNGAKPW